MADNVPKEIEFIADRLIELPFGKIVGNAGIYFLILKGAVVYVGMTTTGARRPMEHLGRKKFDRALYLPIRKADIRDLVTLCGVETAFIQRLKPLLNRGHQAKPFPLKPYHLDLDAWFGEGRDVERARIAAYHKARRNEYKAKQARARAIPDSHLATFSPKAIEKCLAMRKSDGSTR